ncbi:hypothetical protein AVEN_206820-1 [Araneus ventricosus]|uniref:Uncharacterized protein n=1 Tax=Araneus ventricosus TaxID=182803 RepID=A0A4Y2NSB4_ARAVE|nr:hypothetical protein AVEN_206820-1 [Araneus ventricosus]
MDATEKNSVCSLVHGDKVRYPRATKLSDTVTNYRARYTSLRKHAVISKTVNRPSFQTPTFPWVSDKFNCHRSGSIARPVRSSRPIPKRTLASKQIGV